MNRSGLLNSTIGEYRITEMLGAGGMGEVYKAVHSKIGRVVAIKVLSNAAPGQEFVERFLNEARIQASLHHANIATLYDFLEFNNQPCIIMEYVEGVTLTDHVRARRSLALPEAIQIFRAVVDAIICVHAQGIIHRDIKSNNIKITPAGQVKLLDFGIAKSGSSPALTVTGGFIGTLQYLSPEQLKGGVADARSDIWALGVLLYEMVTGYMPFEATTLGELYEKVSRAAYTPPSIISQAVPRQVEAIIARCLKKNPSDRFQSGHEMIEALNRLGAAAGKHQTLAAPPPATYSATIRPAEGRPAEIAPREAYDRNLHDRGARAGGSKLPIIAAVIAGVLLLSGAGAFILFGGLGASKPASKPLAVQPGSSNRPAAVGAQMRTLTVDVAEGRAQVYRAGEMISTTPYRFEAKSGDQINLILKQEGFVDKTVEFSVTDNRKVYTFAMQKR